MSNQLLHIYRGVFKMPFNAKELTFFVASDQFGAASDLRTAASAFACCPLSLLTPCETVTKTTRRALVGADPIKKCDGWAWVK